MAWFGVGMLLLPESAGPAFTAAAVRVAEGGAEYVRVGRCRIPELLLRGAARSHRAPRRTARLYAFPDGLIMSVVVAPCEHEKRESTSESGPTEVSSIGPSRLPSRARSSIERAATSQASLPSACALGASPSRSALATST